MSNQSGFIVRFWGVRGSNPQCGAQYVKVGGHTSCVSVEIDGTLLILDAGTGISDLGNWVAAEKNYSAAHLFLTHAHLDHIIGFPFFTPIWNKEFVLDIHADLSVYGGIESVFTTIISPPYFPVPWKLIPSTRNCQDLTVGDTITLNSDISVSTFALDHPGGGCGFRIERGGHSLAYISDTAHKPGVLWKDLVDFVQGVDILIYDATFTEEEFSQRPDWGHSTWSEGLKIAEKANVGELFLYHHEYNHSDDLLEDIEFQARTIFPKTSLAREGMERKL